MKLFLSLVLGCLLFATEAMALTTYDWKSGNSYNTNRDSSGNTNVQGHNFNNGSSWQTNIKPNGDMNGWDSRGNYWTYNDNSGYYHNYGTGKSCIGKGYARTCN